MYDRTRRCDLMVGARWWKDEEVINTLDMSFRGGWFRAQIKACRIDMYS